MSQGDSALTFHRLQLPEPIQMPDNPDNPRVSVIITAHNRATLLPRAIQSVLAQTYGNYEIVIVDDGSSDDTPTVIADFEDSRIRSVRRNRSGGASAARNTGISESRGEYIAFLDDDDEWTATKLEHQVAILDSSPPIVAMVYGWVNFVDDLTGDVTHRERIVMEGDIFDNLVAMRTPGPTSVLMVRTSVAREVNGFDESLPRHNDIDFICRISRHYHVALLREVILLHHGGHGHERISDNTPQSISHAVSQLRRHMVTYADELDRRPKAHAAVLRSIAVMEFMRGNLLASAAAAMTSFKLDPTGVCRALITKWRTVVSLLVNRIHKPPQSRRTSNSK